MRNINRGKIQTFNNLNLKKFRMSVEENIFLARVAE